MTALGRGWTAITMAAMVSIFVMTSQPAAGKKKTYTFKNESAVAANDFHVVLNYDAYVPASATNASAYKTIPLPREQAFADRVFDPAKKDSFDWTSAESLKEIPADGKMEVNLSGEKPELKVDRCYFTRNNVRLDTKGVAVAQRIVPGSYCGIGTVEFCNAFYSEAVLLTGIEVRVDNTGDPNQVGPYMPDGMLVPGIPSSFSLAPGETRSFPYMATDPSLAVSLSDTAAFASSPDDCYHQLMAARLVELLVPDNVTISYNPGTSDVEIRWCDAGNGLSYKIYRAIDDPLGTYRLIGTVPAYVQFYADFACVNMKAFYYVTASCEPAPSQNCMPCEQAFQITGFVYAHSFSTCEWNGLQQNCLVGCHPYELDCAGPQYPAGPKIFYRLTMTCTGMVDILCVPSPTMDPQLMLFTVCPTIGGVEDCYGCVASSDTGSYPWNGMPERIITMIGPGVFYLSVDCYQNAGPNSCGYYELLVTNADCPWVAPTGAHTAK